MFVVFACSCPKSPYDSLKVATYKCYLKLKIFSARIEVEYIYPQYMNSTQCYNV